MSKSLIQLAAVFLTSLHVRAVTDDDKSFKICSVSGGLDVTRLVSSTTRSLFRSAIEDVELMREVIGESAYNGGVASGMYKLDELSHTLAWRERSTPEFPLTANDTTVTAGLGYSDDNPDRHIERYVSLSENAPLVGNKETDMAMVEAAGNIFPWIVDRRSVPSKWALDHQNGKTLPNEGKSNKIEQLYTAAWIGTKGEAWLYYPPLTIFGHPLGFGDILGGHYDSHEEEFVKPNLPENNPTRISYFTKPYPDTAMPGLSLITAQAPVYFTGLFHGYEYQQTYIASTGVDIAVSAVSSYLDVLQESLTPHSFGILVDSENFHTLVISKYATQKLYPILTGMEETRVTYDPDGNIVQDRRNQTYLPSDTILQPLVELSNADWQGLLERVHQSDRGQRDMASLNVTLTGDVSPTSFHVMFDRWETVADWALLVFVPMEELSKTIQVYATEESPSSTSSSVDAVGNFDRLVEDVASETVVALEGVIGDILHGNISIVNSGYLDLLVYPKSLPHWISLENHDLDGVEHADTLLSAGKTLRIEFDVYTQGMSVGTQSSALAFRVQDANYPDCLYSEDLSIQVTVKVSPNHQCDTTSEEMDSQGNCVCKSQRVYIFSNCITIGALIGFVLVPILVLTTIILAAIVWQKARHENALWQISEKEIKYDSPPRQLGKGGFGVVFLAEYRGTQVAVKKLHGRKNGHPKSKVIQKRNHSSGSVDMTHKLSAQGKPTHNTMGRALTEAAPVDHIDPQEFGASSVSYETSSNPVHSAGGSHPNAFSTLHMSTQKKKNFALKDFATDMRLLSSLRHPCITTIMGAVVTSKSDPLLVMEYVDHKALSDLLQKSTVHLDGDTILGLVRDITQGVQFLHNTTPPVIHGDLKSHNILVDSKFHGKVTDFGISYKVGIKGTPFWMAPEILRRESDPTAASDVYSFGITLYEIYARKEPYAGEAPAVVIREVADPTVNIRPVPPSCMPNRVAALMHDCLVGNPLERPNMDEIVSRIRRFSSRDVAPIKTYSGTAQQTEDEEARQFEDLLRRFPRHIAEDLRDGREVAPENHESATVFVGDVVDFDKIAMGLSQKKVFDMIRRWHECLDKLAQEKQVFKIETTGETWMGATNCATSQPHSHARIMADFALVAVEAAGRIWVDPDQPALGFLQVRVGFHSGPVLANVIGSSQQNLRYALFGDTVNAAVRLCQDTNNKPGLVHCTRQASELLKLQADDAFETSSCDKSACGAVWVNIKGQRASAAYDRIRRKQKLRMMRKERRTNDEGNSVDGSSTDDSCASCFSSVDTLDLSAADENLGNDATGKEAVDGTTPSLQLDFGMGSDELALEMGLDEKDDGKKDCDDDDDLTDLEGSLRERLDRSRNKREKINGLV
eukprot:scaffold27769_cov176-Amphora_coffeaeformis.AAC.9